MVAFNPKERLTVKQVIAHPWFTKETATLSKIKADFDQRKATVEEEAHKSREEKRTERDKRKKVKDNGVARGDLDEKDSEETSINRNSKIEQWD